MTTPNSSTVVARIHQAVRDALAPHPRVVLAVSGGIDSMVLLDAAVASGSGSTLRVATFDHATGPAARRAARLVAAVAATLGVPCVSRRASVAARDEATLRRARWEFLRACADSDRSVVCTAHTADDQLETVLMRVLRAAGARGLAGLYAASDVVRPLLAFRRADIEAYADARRLPWVEDPSNASREYLRNRVRHDLLPALRAVRPNFDVELLELASAAADWRNGVERYVDEQVRPRARRASGALDVPAEGLTSQSAVGLAVLWPAIAARVGATLDRRGTARLAEFTASGTVGSRMPLSGGWTVTRSRDAFQLRASAELTASPAEEPLAPMGETRWCDWSFRLAAEIELVANAWTALLPADEELRVRNWRPGDTMCVRVGGLPSKVKRLLSDAGVTGHDRRRWPVVVAGEAGKIVWLPGVCRSDAATVRPGRPGLPFVCEHVEHIERIQHIERLERAGA
jgi:tRNA(Ile)-lysidine synthase